MLKVVILCISGKGTYVAPVSMSRSTLGSLTPYLQAPPPQLTGSLPPKYPFPQNSGDSPTHIHTHPLFLCFALAV